MLLSRCWYERVKRGTKYPQKYKHRRGKRGEAKLITSSIRIIFQGKGAKINEIILLGELFRDAG